jgi:hypothetical protein
MSKIASHLHEPPSNAQGPKPEEISRQLKNILASPAFHGSRRCQQFLEYVVEKSLAGEGGFLKERMIAIDVFGRPPQTDLGEDTIVRVGAREVRKRLAQYYVTPDGLAAEIRVDLPSGSYAPDFKYVTPAPEEIPVPPAAPVPVVVEHRTPWWKPKRWPLYLGAALVAAIAIVVAVRWYAPTPNTAEFSKFWQPVFMSDEPLLIAVAHPIVYHPSGRAIRLSEANQPPQDPVVQRPIQVPPNQLNGSDFVPVFNQYVGFGDMVAANEVSAMLAHKNRSARIRMANTINFADLRKAQTLLIGAVTNHWTMELQQAWRYRFNWTPGTRTVIVDAKAAPSAPQEWSIPASDDGSTLDDYVLVCRIHSGFTGGLVMVGAGLKQFGTEAAGRLLTDQEQLGAILRKLPAGWENKNVQLVLHARVIGNTPAQPEVVGSYVW